MTSGATLWPLGVDEASHWVESLAALKRELESSLHTHESEPADWLRAVVGVLGSASPAPEVRAEALDELRGLLIGALPLCGREALPWETVRRVGSAIDRLLATPAPMRLCGFLPERWAPQGYQPRACRHPPHFEPPESLFILSMEAGEAEVKEHSKALASPAAAADASAEVARGVRFDPALGPAVSEESLLASTVERGLDWMALTATHRLSRARSEAEGEQERFLQLMDGLLVLGPDVLPCVEQWWAINEDSPDSWKVAAPSFFLASLEHPDAPTVLGRILAGLQGDSSVQVVAAARGIALARGSGALWIGNELAASRAPVERAIGIASLSLRGQATGQQILDSLADPHPLVLEQALAAAARSRQAVVPVQALRSCLRHPAEPVVLAAAGALLLHGDPEPMLAAREGALGASSCALDVCALAGSGSDRPVVEQQLRSTPLSSRVLSSLGRLGDIAHVPVLLEALADDELCEAAVQALELMFGQQSLAAGVSVDEPHSWKGWFDASSFDRDQRYRLGAPYGPCALELEYRVGDASYLQLSQRLVEFSIRYRVRVDSPLCGWNEANEAELGSALAATRAMV